MPLARALFRANPRYPGTLSCSRPPLKYLAKRFPDPLICHRYLEQHHDFSITPLQRQSPPKADTLEIVKPEAVQKQDDAKSFGPKTDALLAEQTVSNKEQRKADWAIMKEMVRYLWPKVGRDIIYTLAKQS